MIELIDDSSKGYEVKHPSGATFTILHWTVGMQEEVDRQCIVIDAKGSVSYLPSKERELKLKLAVAGWSDVMLNGEIALCTNENKMRLPVGVMFWIVKEIDERAGLRMTDTEKKISN